MPTADRYQQYEVLRREDGSLWELGRGAMGITYKAYDTNLRFTVALKVINSAYLESDTARQRFLREARAAAALRHPNVASVFNLGTDRENYFYVMEFIDGETVQSRVKRNGPLKPVEALNIALQVARALAVAAKQQLVHRDLKPTNLMIVDQEEELTVKVIDFGLAKVAKEVGEDSMALTVGGFIGTPHFASPEQVEEGDVDVRSDFYSLGATLYFVLTGQSPFSGSIGQIMSQHLYKPLPMEPLTNLPPCVASLVRRMMEKDRNARPQTAQELQKAILACLDEIRGSPSTGVPRTNESASASETVDLTFASGQPLAPGVTLAQTYKLLEELVESPHGRKFLADDLRHNRRVNLLVLSPEFLADGVSLSALREAVGLLRKAPHKMLREVYSLETFGDCSFLVEEHVGGTSLLDLLRKRGALAAPEVSRLLDLLAPLADHASKCELQHVDLVLSGVFLLERVSSQSGISANLLGIPLTAWEALNAKVDAIDFSFSPDRTGTWSGMATRVDGPNREGARGTYVRLLSLLAYELLGGPRARLDATGQYTPLATLTREGNAVLRRGIVDEFSSAGELSRQLMATIESTPVLPVRPDSAERVAPESLRRSPSSTPLPSQSQGRLAPEPLRRPPSSFHPSPEPKERGAPEPLRRTPPPMPPPGGPHKGRFRIPPWLWALSLSLMVLLGIGVYLINSFRKVQEIAALSVRTEPPGASFLLDGKPPQLPPGTFTHVPFGSHQLSATRDNYQPVKQDIQVSGGMSPEIRLQLKPIEEIPVFSIQIEPPGATILLDGKPPQVLPNIFTHVPFGPHRLSARLDDYQPIERDIQVGKAMSPEIRLELKPIQEIAALNVQADPSGVTILLDGKPPQVAPGTFTHVPFGPHRLSATLDDYQPIERDIQVGKGMSPEIRLQLKPIQEIAALNVQTDPSGASIFLDGKPPQVPPGSFTHVPFGPHRLSATLDDYQPIEQDLQVRKAMNPEIRLQLKPIQEIPALNVQADPLGATILLDGKPPQVPPGTFTHVPFGPHRLSAALDDYQPIERDFQVGKGMNPEIRLQLKPIQEIAALNVQADPLGATILLDGKPPQVPPSTFTHVPFGPHRLSATLDDYQPVELDIQVRKVMNPEIRLQLKPLQEIAALKVQTNPSGATILLDGKPPQVPPGTFTHVPFGPHRLSASLDDYQPIEQDLQVGKAMSPEIRLQLKPIQEIAALKVQTDPSGATILLDSKPPQVPPGTFTHVPFGPHRLSAVLDDYQSIEQDIQIGKAMNPEIRLQLKPIQEIAALKVQTDPSGATILLDSKPPQVPPGTFTHVPFGPHRLSAALDDYQSIEQDIQIGKAMNPEIRLQLKPIQEIAALNVQTDPSGAKMLLDGKPPQVPPGTFTHVPFGPHRLSAALDDYQPIERDFQVGKGMNREIRLQLKPIQEIAALNVQTNPSGATILLDGKPPQVPPGTFTHVPFGPHRLSAALDDYQPIEQDIQVGKAMNLEIRLQLKPIQEIAALKVQTDPSGATILLDGKPPQVPPGTFTHVPFGPHRLSAALDDYQPIEQDIQVGKAMNPEIRLQLKPIREIAALKVQADPSGATILLDGKPPQVPPGTFTHVPFGPHRLSAALDDYQPIEQDIQVGKAMNPEIRLQLKPIQEIAALNVQTEPSGATILLDGKPPQVPPGTFTHVPFGPHRLSAALDDYQPTEQDIQAGKAMNPEIRLQLKPIQEIAALKVQTNPSSANILLDGKPPQVPPGTFTHVPFGPHRLSAALDDYQPIEQDIQVGKAMNPEIRLQLKPIQEIAALNVQTEPSGANILLDGKTPQVPPATFSHVSFGPHQLSATLDGYDSTTQEIEIRAGMTPEIHLQLKPSQETFQSLLRDAQLGDPTAMMKLGLLYLRKGTLDDDTSGFNWLNRAFKAPNPNLEAGVYVADCYLSGKGTKQDIRKAEEITMPLANQKVVRAMTLAGRILQIDADEKRKEAAASASPKMQKRLNALADDLDRQARQWWERAEKDDWNASAHLANCYEEGWGGLEKSEDEAEKRYKAGVEHGNSLSMFFYGLMIDKKSERHLEAQNLISRAAAVGLPSAIKWCKDKHVAFGEQKTGDIHR